MARKLYFQAPLWEKGFSGNPKGLKRKGYQIPEILRRIGKEGVPPALADPVRAVWGEAADKMTMLEVVLRRAYMEAIAGNLQALAFISDHTEGRLMGPPPAPPPAVIVNVSTTEAAQDTAALSDNNRIKELIQHDN